MSLPQTPTLSKRGQIRSNDLAFAQVRPSSLLATKQDLGTFDSQPASKLYDAEKNPDGVINLSTAENSLMTTELLEYIHKHFSLTPTHLKYRVALLRGFVDCTVDALPLYLNETLNPLIPITPENCVPGPGLGALMAQFFWTVCDEGDGVMLTTPYYSDYPRDVNYPACAVVVPAYVPAGVDSLSTDCLQFIEKTIVTSNATGTRIRALLLCNPHNPLARAYPKETIIGYAALAEKYDLHLLVDEVYANQVFSSSAVPNPPPFISILSLDIQTLAKCDPSRVHVIAGPSKDLGASGLKVGAFISQHNPDMVNIMTASLGAFPISSASDAALTPVMNDAKFRRWFLEENRKRLAEAFETVAAWCTFHHIPFEPASAGVFFVADFARFVEVMDGKPEDKLGQFINILLNSGVYIGSTDVYEDPVKNRFRITFTLSKGEFRLALSRIEKALSLEAWTK